MIPPQEAWLWGLLIYSLQQVATQNPGVNVSPGINAKVRPVERRPETVTVPGQLHLQKQGRPTGLCFRSGSAPSMQ